MIDIDSFASDPPGLDHWGEERSTGGLNSAVLKFLYQLVTKEAHERPVNVVETGAGNSTIVFLMAGAQRVLSFALEPDLETRIRDYCLEHGVPSEHLEFVGGRSEATLPPYALANPLGFDIALIDGGHGWPTVFIDFCYLNSMLRKGGVLLIDDVQLYSVREVAKLVNSQWQFEPIENVGKLFAWRKISDEAFLPDFVGQPYVVRQSAAADPIRGFEDLG